MRVGRYVYMGKNRTEQEILVELTKLSTLVSPGVHAFIRVVQVG